MNLELINQTIKSAHPFWHLLTSVIILGYLTYLIMSYITYIKLCYKLGSVKEITLFFLDVTAPCFIRRTNLFFSFIVMSFIFFGKFSSPNYTMLDVFLPVYACYYTLAKIVIENLKEEVKELINKQQVCEVKIKANEYCKS